MQTKARIWSQHPSTTTATIDGSYNGSAIQNRNGLDPGLRDLLAQAAQSNYTGAVVPATGPIDFGARHQQILAAKQQLERLLLINYQQAEISGVQMPVPSLPIAQPVAAPQFNPGAVHQNFGPMQYMPYSQPMAPAFVGHMPMQQHQEPPQARIDELPSPSTRSSRNSSTSETPGVAPSQPWGSTAVPMQSAWINTARPQQAFNYQASHAASAINRPSTQFQPQNIASHIKNTPINPFPHRATQSQYNETPPMPEQQSTMMQQQSHHLSSAAAGSTSRASISVSAHTNSAHTHPGGTQAAPNGFAPSQSNRQAVRPLPRSGANSPSIHKPGSLPHNPAASHKPAAQGSSSLQGVFGFNQGQARTLVAAGNTAPSNLPSPVVPPPLPPSNPSVQRSTTGIQGSSETVNSLNASTNSKPRGSNMPTRSFPGQPSQMFIPPATSDPIPSVLRSAAGTQASSQAVNSQNIGTSSKPGGNSIPPSSFTGQPTQASIPVPTPQATFSEMMSRGQLLQRNIPFDANQQNVIANSSGDPTPRVLAGRAIQPTAQAWAPHLHVPTPLPSPTPLAGQTSTLYQPSHSQTPIHPLFQSAATTQVSQPSQPDKQPTSGGLPPPQARVLQSPLQPHPQPQRPPQPLQQQQPAQSTAQPSSASINDIPLIIPPMGYLTEEMLGERVPHTASAKFIARDFLTALGFDLSALGKRKRGEQDQANVASPVALGPTSLPISAPDSAAPAHPVNMDIQPVTTLPVGTAPPTSTISGANVDHPPTIASPQPPTPVQPLPSLPIDHSEAPVPSIPALPQTTHDEPRSAMPLSSPPATPVVSPKSGSAATPPPRIPLFLEESPGPLEQDVETEFSQLDLDGGQGLNADEAPDDVPVASGSGSSHMAASGSNPGSSRNATTSERDAPRFLPNGRRLNSSTNPSPYPQRGWVAYVAVPPLKRRKRATKDIVKIPDEGPVDAKLKGWTKRLRLHPCEWTGCAAVLDSIERLERHILKNHVEVDHRKCEWNGHAFGPVFSKSELMKHVVDRHTRAKLVLNQDPLLIS
ncbi:hypothetical protein BOTBODRAFT_556661 [Botryobasidium botryosum FD-172 SS1]|uniref:Uncharacterized protein n=1 Tax=Botryobasidium botryosum (strain FD-172 SS1) TaxID=930990 RepID=A0A067M2F6_BOTB1|nr:hypothetical protein BOTBODRAFT_556661 [Botryobasidium botryosum FD-172 SS1]